MDIYSSGFLNSLLSMIFITNSSFTLMGCGYSFKKYIKIYKFKYYIFYIFVFMYRCISFLLKTQLGIIMKIGYFQRPHSVCWRVFWQDFLSSWPPWKEAQSGRYAKLTLLMIISWIGKASWTVKTHIFNWNSLGYKQQRMQSSSSSEN